MKVLDLYCSQGHVFEGWFGSEKDFQQQRSAGFLQCPLCGCVHIEKGLSAPRLNLGAAKPKAEPAHSTRQQAPVSPPSAPPLPALATEQHANLRALQAAWMKASRVAVKNSEDVGAHFAEQALQMHRGELEEKPIRGQASLEQARELLEEGVAIMPLMLPKDGGENLQ
ncbi:MAG: DUF1178 family protein [Comamonas sp.]|nr:DUF1178 family protein [Comamonas sp.]